MKPRILLADDHALVLEGFQRLLESEFTIVGTAIDGRQVIERAEQLKPDLILLDISMPVMNGIEAMRRLRISVPAARLLVVTQQTDRHYVQAAFRAGARGYVLKQSAAAELVAAMRDVIAGRFYVTPLVTDSAIASQVNPNINPGELFGASLTPRQREVLQLIAEGRQAKEIAAVLKISPKTVEFHKAAIMDHLGLRTTAELTRYALEQGIIG